MATLIDSYQESGSWVGINLGSGETYKGVGQAFTGANTTLDSCKFYIFNPTSATGNIYALVYDSTGTFGTNAKPTGSALATSNAISASTLLSYMPSLITFTFSGSSRIELSSSKKYILVLRYTDTGTIVATKPSTSPSHNGNASFTSDFSSWTTDSAADVYFYVYGVSGTDASSERGLYTKGKNTGSSERGLYTKGYLASSSERNLYLEGDISPLYSKESSSSLKTNDTNLANIFTQQEYTDVTTDNDTYVDLVGTHEYFQFLFKEPNNNSTDDFRITWKGKSTVAPSSHTVYLQIYNRTTSTWTNLTSNNSASANTKFTLTYDVTTGMSDYYDANHVISARIYQDVVV